MSRVISFEQAKARYPHRYTMEHVPLWAYRPPYSHGGSEIRFYATQFTTDREWYDNTLFPGEGGVPKRSKYCETSGWTFPLGHWLTQPFDHRSIHR